MAEIDLDSLPAGMHVLSAMSCRAEGKGPSYKLINREIDKIILSSTGEIGVYHTNLSTDSFHTITDLSMVEKVEYSPAEVVHPKRFHLLTMLSFLVGVVWLMLALLILYNFIINFDYYYSYQAPMTAKETAQEAAWAVPVLLLGAPIFYLPLLVKDRLGRWARQEKLQIQIVGNQQLTFFGKFPDEFRLNFGKFSAWFVGLMLSLTVLQGDFLVGIIAIYTIMFVVMCVYIVSKAAIFGSNTDSIDSRGKSSIRSMNNFHMSIETILGSESGVSGTMSLRSLESRLGGRIKELKRRLEVHEEMLDNLTQKNWAMVLKAPVEYMGMAQIRRCVEKLLTPLVKKLGIAIKPTDRGVGTLKNILVKNHAISSDVLLDLEIIEAITNPAAHDFDTSEDNYITSLTSFARLVEWYVEVSNESLDEE